MDGPGESRGRFSMMKHTEATETRSVRLLRVGEQVRHILSEILQRGDVHDETLASHLVSVTEVRMSPDLRHATVFVKPLLGKDEDGGAQGAAHQHRLSPARGRRARADEIRRQAQVPRRRKLRRGHHIDTLLRDPHRSRRILDDGDA